MRASWAAAFLCIATWACPVSLAHGSQTMAAFSSIPFAGHRGLSLGSRVGSLPIGRGVVDKRQHECLIVAAESRNEDVGGGTGKKRVGQADMKRLVSGVRDRRGSGEEESSKVWDGRVTANLRKGVLEPGKLPELAFPTPSGPSGGVLREHKNVGQSQAQGDSVATNKAPKAKAKEGQEFIFTAAHEQQLFAAFGDKLSMSLDELLVDDDAAADLPWADEVELSESTSQSRVSERPKGQERPEKNAGKKKGSAPSSGARSPESTGELGVSEILAFEREGHVFAGRLAGGSDLETLRCAVEAEFERRAIEAYTQKLRVFGASDALIKRCGESRASAKKALQDLCAQQGFEVPFLQIFNMHRASNEDAATIRNFALSKRLGRMAADLLGVDSVMLYQTAAFFKEKGHGETAWHSDLNTAPFDTNSMLTFWIALTDVPDREHSPLEFASRSHRDFALPYWYTNEGMENLETRGYSIRDHSPILAGEATAHHGWVLHSAPPNESGRDRKALAITYVNAGARRLPVKDTRRVPDDEDKEGYKSWVNDVPPGKSVSHKLLPIAFSRADTTGEIQRK